MSKTLTLIPTPLGEELQVISPYVIERIMNLNVFIVERIKTARRFLRSVGYKRDFDTEVSFFELDKHGFSLEELYTFLLNHEQIGLLSEAGNPCVADPGAKAVSLAHELKFKVQPLVGPSSIILALISSGLNGQNFTFHGYLPIDKGERNKTIKRLESESLRSGYSQIFMETPYRNDALIELLLKLCHRDTKLCVACDISLVTEHIETRTINNWQKGRPKFHKRPAIFVLGAGS